MRSGFDAKPLYCVLTALGILFLSEASTWAHKVNVFAYVQGDTAIVEGYFSGNVKAQDSLVEVFDSDGKKILEGKTDTKGMYSFKLADLPPIKGDIKIVLDGGMGHKADFTLSMSDLPSSAQETRSPQQKLEKEESADSSLAEARPSVHVQDMALLKKVVEDAVDEKIQPLTKMLGNQQRLLMEQKDRGPTMTEIIGGIGWILGIVGVTGYFMGRTRKARN